MYVFFHGFFVSFYKYIFWLNVACSDLIFLAPHPEYELKKFFASLIESTSKNLQSEAYYSQLKSQNFLEKTTLVSFK